MLAGWVQALCPESCPRCSFESAQGFCASCRREFLRVPSPCPRCALPMPCAPCPANSRRWQLDRIRAPFVYTQPLKQFLLQLKFSRQRLLGVALGQLLAGELAATSFDCDTLAVVPLHRRRLVARSFNQADEIARPVAARFGLRMLAAELKRQVDSAPQSTLKRGERFRGLEQAFAVDAGIEGLRIAIADDVITTGATVNSLAAALRAAGAAHVEAVAVARTIGP